MSGAVLESDQMVRLEGNPAGVAEWRVLHRQLDDVDLPAGSLQGDGSVGAVEPVLPARRHPGSLLRGREQPVGRGGLAGIEVLTRALAQIPGQSREGQTGINRTRHQPPKTAEDR